MREIDCRSCIAACCGPNIQVQLTEDERQFLEEAGTIIEEVVPPLPMDGELIVKPKDPNILDLADAKAQHIRAGHGVYILFSRCGYVVYENGFPHACGVYNDPRRPDVCGDFSVGGRRCQSIRESRSVRG